MTVVPLRRVAKLVNGGTPTTDPENWGGDVSWATPVDLAVVDGGVVNETQRSITRAGLRSVSASVPAGSVLLSIRAPIGYLARTASMAAFNQGCRGIVPTADIDVGFLLYALMSARSSLVAAGTGSTFQELSSEALANSHVPLHPLPEQRRIAEFLDDQVARLDAAVSAARDVTALLEHRLEALRQQHVDRLGDVERRPVRSLFGYFTDGDWIESPIIGSPIAASGSSRPGTSAWAGCVWTPSDTSPGTRSRTYIASRFDPATCSSAALGRLCPAPPLSLIPCPSA